MAFFFFKQKTAYEMRMSDWSSDVCSADLRRVGLTVGCPGPVAARHQVETAVVDAERHRRAFTDRPAQPRPELIADATPRPGGDARIRPHPCGHTAERRLRDRKAARLVGKRPPPVIDADRLISEERPVGKGWVSKGSPSRSP